MIIASEQITESASRITAVDNGIGKSACGSGNRDSSVAHSQHLAQPARLKKARHKENIAASINAAGKFGIEANIAANFTRVSVLGVAESVFVIGVAAA